MPSLTETMHGKGQRLLAFFICKESGSHNSNIVRIPYKLKTNEQNECIPVKCLKKNYGRVAKCAYFVHRK